MLVILFDLTNKNLLLGFIPESLGLLLFGIGLIAFAVSLRWIFNRNEENGKQSFPAFEAMRGGEKITEE
ncbi:MAG: hypothetical protein ACR2HG_07045 [Pyrinomonadaceae bacterium]